MKGLLRTEHRFLRGNALDALRGLPDESIHCCVTSPPYWGLRSYLPDDHPDKQHELGSETTPEEYVAKLVEVFREVRRVLRPESVAWLNLGDSFARDPKKGGAGTPNRRNDPVMDYTGNKPAPTRCKQKDLVGIPWMVAFALRDDGWWLRSDIIWAKPSCLPESVTDRPTRSHEYIFLLTKSAHYFYDADAIREPHDDKAGPPSRFGVTGQANAPKKVDGRGEARARVVSRVPPTGGHNPLGRNARSVWVMNPQPFKAAHFAVYPVELPSRCIKAGTSECGCCPKCKAPWERIVTKRKLDYHASVSADRKPLHSKRYSRHRTNVAGGQSLVGYERSTAGFRPGCDCAAHEPVPCTVLDPFAGAGTTALAAKRLGRHSLNIELCADYIRLAEARRAGGGVIAEEGPMIKLLSDWFEQLCETQEEAGDDQ